MLLSHITKNCFIKIVSRNLNRFGNHGSAQSNHGNVCCSSSNIDNHIPLCLRYIYSGTDCSRYRLFNDTDLSGPCMTCRVHYGFFFNLCCSAGNTNANPRLSQGSSSHCLVYKILQHFFRKAIVRNNPLAKRTNRGNVLRCAPQHESGILSICHNVVILLIDRNHGRLFQNNPSTLYINQDTGCT